MLFQILIWLELLQVEAVYIGRIPAPSDECPSRVVAYGIGTQSDGTRVAILHPKYLHEPLTANPEQTNLVCEGEKE